MRNLYPVGILAEFRSRLSTPQAGFGQPVRSPKAPPHKAGVDRYTSRVIIVSIVICVPVNPSANLQA
jgi:hypothetical protein